MRNLFGILARIIFFGVVAIIGLSMTLLFADWLYRTGLTPAKWTLIGVYFILTIGLALGFTQFFVGFLISFFRFDPLKITKRCSLKDAEDPKKINDRIALLFPIYNEDPMRVFNGIEVVYQALKEAGQMNHFTFFVLSDSTDSNQWIEEEKVWLERVIKLEAQGRLIYRHRSPNINQKSGNISDFCRRWGAHFDHMICFDADSLMSAECILKLVQLIENNPEIGIIQTMPGLIGGQTLFARLQQFVNRIHGEITGAGLNFWQQNNGNYWGHNAIIRLEPFTKHCTLPELPGPKPLGGRVMSHDFVDAALMKKAGYEVWLAYDLPGTYEELPPTFLDFAQRDRRWCQGNLQHAWIAFLGKIPFINRVHMLNGIYAYISGPLWLVFLSISTLAAYSWEFSNLTPIIRVPLLPYSPQSLAEHGLVIFGLTITMILLPKLLTICRLFTNTKFRRAFGNPFNASLSIIIEIFIFTLFAPTMMLFHSAFVFSILTGGKVGWAAQNRSSHTHTSWHAAALAHTGQTVVGILWAVLAWKINPMLFSWMIPVLAGWIFSIPISVFTSHVEPAEWLRRHGLLLTPEEINPPDIIRSLEIIEEEVQVKPQPIKVLRNDYGLIQALLDPYTNALHLEFLPRRENQSVESKERLSDLSQKLLKEGAPGLTGPEKQRLLNDHYTVHSLHRHLWSISEQELPDWWQIAINRFSRESLFVTELGPGSEIGYAVE
ncbi:MAG: glucans biosynthesis glucosyltransferase MdoH [Verrucomicrobiota bacterium]